MDEISNEIGAGLKRNYGLSLLLEGLCDCSVLRLFVVGTRGGGRVWDPMANGPRICASWVVKNDHLKDQG